VAFSDAERRRAEEIVARYPHSKSALLPLLHMAQDRDGYVTGEAMEDIAELLGLTPALVLGTCSFYTMFKRAPIGNLVVSVCTNVSCLVNGGPALVESLRARYADDTDVHVEEVECVAACDLAPVMQVNYEFHGPVTTEAAVDVIEQYKAGTLTARTISGSPVQAAASVSGSGTPTRSELAKGSRTR
jgi:NADH:ubiquinone oxidoreductase subunit E